VTTRTTRKTTTTRAADDASIRGNEGRTRRMTMSCKTAVVGSGEGALLLPRRRVEGASSEQVRRIASPVALILLVSVSSPFVRVRFFER
jgi:hypothetical protein